MKAKRCSAVFLLRRVLRALVRIAQALESLDEAVRRALDQPDPRLTMEMGDAEASVTIMTDRESQEHEEEDERNARLQ